MEYYSAIKNNEIMPFAATWIDLEIILSEVSQPMKDRHMISLLCGILKKGYKLICRTETDSQTLKTNLWLPKGTGDGGGMNWGLGLAFAHCSLWNYWPTGTCCIAQGSLSSILQ